MSSMQKLQYLSRILFCAILLPLLAPLASPICVDIIWIQTAPNADPLYQFSDQSGTGYIDQSGKVVIPAGRLHSASSPHAEFHDGLMLLGNYPHASFIDSKGNPVKFENVDQASEFSDGIAPALDKNTQKWGFINTRGDFVIPPTHQRWTVPFVSSFSDGMALIQIYGKNGFLDRTGALAIEANLLEAHEFHDDASRVIIEGPCKLHSRPCSSFPGMFVLPGYGTPTGATPLCRYAFIDKTGRPLFSQRFDDAKDFSEELAPVKIDGKWGFINKTGALVVKPQFDSADSFSDGLALVSQNGLSGFITHDGTFAVAPQFKYAEHFVDGLSLVGKDWPGATNNNFWYIDRTGRQAIPDSFPLATSFFKGLAHVKLPEEKGKIPTNLWAGIFAYIDRTGKKVFTYEIKSR